MHCVDSHHSVSIMSCERVGVVVDGMARKKRLSTFYEPLFLQKTKKMLVQIENEEFIEFTF